ncbi:hypothetical protein M413DRAFT_30604 [Hebeloma cylindrosporum]|uniref:Uncharacterized protein n=1 Tax=Hebeloma cylindrosporum TaxID=76867 RepID=A0A0C2YAA3_HEBCY|nr:hypothetical protein M413DRAFT_30604 [Hebeloma cylindrosporum h7]
MLFILGLCPNPLDPCVFQFAAHGLKLEALHSAFISEWHLKLRAKLFTWNQAGPKGDISSFDIFLEETLGFGAHTVQLRTESSHGLQQSLLGPEPPFHPEWNGFNFLSVLKSFEEGSEGFFSLFWTSYIQAYELLAHHFLFNDTPVIAGLNSVLAQANSIPIKEKIIAFLQGTGIPCLAQFDREKPAFGSFPGSPFIDPDSEAISQINIVNETDGQYPGHHQVNGILMAFASKPVYTLFDCQHLILPTSP